MRLGFASSVLVPLSLSFTFRASMPRSLSKRSIVGLHATQTPPKKRQRSAVVTPEVKKRSLPKVKVMTMEEAFSDTGFVDLEAPPAELRASATLTTGQCFCWTAIPENGQVVDDASAWGTFNATQWIGIVRNQAGASFVLVIRERPETTLFKVLYSENGYTEADVKSFLLDYFQLSVSLNELYKEWSDQCPRLKAIAQCIPGMRIVDQEPWECLVSFLCSSNNNIPRITKMIGSIRKNFGDHVVTITAADNEDTLFYTFPSLEALAGKGSEDTFRNKCGMGYRAKYLKGTVDLLNDKGLGYLTELKSQSDAVAVQERLIEFMGVGRKVADCVALFSLKQCTAIPVDVHVWNIALRDYLTPETEDQLKNARSMTPTVYKMVGDLFRTRFPSRSGWANSLLFVAELPSFRAVLPAAIVEDMDNFRKIESEKKQKEKAKKNAKAKGITHQQ